MKHEAPLKIALAIYSNPGVYALVLGSGISKPAQIPLGGEIVFDLIHKLARMMGEEVGLDAVTWYQERFGDTPGYPQLMEKLTRTPAERMGLLRAYFEPTEDEREQGIKVPTAAHRAIARLVKLNYIRMILTTNFDRLMEIAVQDEGIVPDIIDSEDSLRGAMPYIHSKCYIVKLHGDYRDTRLRNTPAELAEYPDAINRLLDRILDEFGFIIVGWSGESDQALKDAMLRVDSCRFSTFWLTIEELTPGAREIVQQRCAEVSGIESADQFFTDLVKKIEALREG
jgi:hypothetical protein